MNMSLLLEMLKGGKCLLLILSTLVKEYAVGVSTCLLARIVGTAGGCITSPAIIGKRCRDRSEAGVWMGRTAVLTLCQECLGEVEAKRSGGASS